MTPIQRAAAERLIAEHPTLFMNDLPDWCDDAFHLLRELAEVPVQEPVAWRHSKTGRLYDSVEEVPLADGDEWAEPLYATPATQQAPAAWRQWSTKLHDWDYQTNRGDLRPDTPADPLFVAAAQLVPLTDEQRNDRIEAWSSQGWGDRLGEVVRICIAIERAHGIAAAGDKP